MSFGKEGVLYQNVYVAVVTTFGSALWLAVLAKVAASAFGQPSNLDLELDHHLGGRRGARFSLHPVGDGGDLSILSYRRGWDLDSVSTPMVTALGDMVTLPTLYLATFLVHNETVNEIVSVICLVVALYAIARAYTVNDSIVRRVILEMTAVILLTPILDIFVGRAAGAPAHGADGGARPADPDPAVRLAGGRPGRDLLVPDSSKLQIGVISPAGCPRAPRSSTAPSCSCSASWCSR